MASFMPAVLLLEDDEVDVLNVKRAFAKNNIQNPLVVAKNGIDGLKYLYKQFENAEVGLPISILLDINMPKMNGIEFLQKLREDDRFNSILVFVLTTSNEDRDKIEAYKLNVAGYILKPLEFDTFVKAIGTIKDIWDLSDDL